MALPLRSRTITRTRTRFTREVKVGVASSDLISGFSAGCAGTCAKVDAQINTAVMHPRYMCRLFYSCAEPLGGKFGWLRVIRARRCYGTDASLPGSSDYRRGLVTRSFRR